MKNGQEDFENVSEFNVEPVEKKLSFQDHDDSNHSKMPKQLCFESLLMYFNRSSKHYCRPAPLLELSIYWVKSYS